MWTNLDLSACFLRIEAIDKPMRNVRLAKNFGDTIPMAEHASATITVELGSMKLAYTGSQDFIDAGLLALIQELVEISDRFAPEEPAANEVTTIAVSDPKVQHMSTNTIASQLGANSGPALVIAAVAHLQLVKKQNLARRADILSEMKGATTFYKTTYGSNLSSYLNGLVRNKRLNLTAENTYALAAQERTRLESSLAAA